MKAKKIKQCVTQLVIFSRWEEWDEDADRLATSAQDSQVHADRMVELIREAIADGIGGLTVVKKVSAVPVPLEGFIYQCISCGRTVEIMNPYPGDSFPPDDEKCSHRWEPTLPF
jgi:hypothetical protein